MSSFVNRDLHPGNVITDAASVFYVCDWENAGAGFMLRDLGNSLAATTIWYGHRDLVLDGFLSIHPLADRESEELRVWESYSLLLHAIGFMKSGDEGAATRLLAELDAIS